MQRVKMTMILAFLSVIATGCFTVSGCRERMDYDDYDSYPGRGYHDRDYDRDHDRDHDRDWDDKWVVGTGRVLLDGKGCNMAKVTAYWDGRRNYRESSVPDKDGFYVIRDLPRDKKIELVSEFDYYNKHFYASDKIRTPRRGGKFNLGTMGFKAVDHGTRDRHDRHDYRPGPGPKPAHGRFGSVRVQGWVTYKGAAVKDVKVYVKSDRTPVWKEQAETDRVGRFVIGKIPSDDKVEIKFVKDTRDGTYSANRKFKTSRDDKDLGTVRLAFSRRKDVKKNDHKPGPKPAGFVNIDGWVEYKGVAVSGVTVYMKADRDSRWVTKGKTNAHGKFRIGRVPYEDKVELKFVKNAKEGTYSGNKKVKADRANKDVGRVKLDFSPKRRRR